MPVETRYIRFSSPELNSAVVDYFASKKDSPYKEILKVSTTKELENPVAVLAYRKDSGNKVTETLSISLVGAALLLHCRLYDIRLPKNAKKSVELSDGKIVLKVAFVSGQAATNSHQSSLGNRPSR